MKGKITNLTRIVALVVTIAFFSGAQSDLKAELVVVPNCVYTGNYNDVCNSLYGGVSGCQTWWGMSGSCGIIIGEVDTIN